MEHVTTRRALVTGAALTVATTAAATLPAFANDGDAELLARAAEFSRLYTACEEARDRSRALYEAAQNDPACPPPCAPILDPEGSARRDAIMESYGYPAAWEASNEASQRVGELAQVIFATPSATVAGILAKARILAVAYGSGPDMEDNDDELHSWQEESWLASLTADLERLAGGGAA